MGPSLKKNSEIKMYNVTKKIWLGAIATPPNVCGSAPAPICHGMVMINCSHCMYVASVRSEYVSRICS